MARQMQLKERFDMTSRSISSACTTTE